MKFKERFLKAEEEAWKGNVKALEEIDDSNVVIHVSGLPNLIGVEAHKQYVLTSLKGLSGLHQEWLNFIEEGDVAAVRLKERWMFTGHLPGFPPPTGKEVKIDCLMMFQLKNGKIIEAWMYAVTTGLIP